MGIVTKSGDEGKTKLLSGEDISKSHSRVETYGTVDELVSQLGMARSLIEDEAFAGEVRDLQIDLMRFIGELATIEPEKQDWVDPTDESHVTNLEDRITELESKIELPRSFIIPGACEVSAALDVARTIARRLERQVVGLFEGGDYRNESGIKYANRLSDYIFILARAVEQAMGIEFDTKRR